MEKLKNSQFIINKTMNYMTAGTKYNSRKEMKIRITESKYSDFSEELVNPNKLLSGFTDDDIYDNLGSDGLPLIGSIIRIGDCIASRERKFKFPKLNSEDNSPICEDISLYAKYGMEGCVTNISIRSCEVDSDISRIITITLKT